MWFVIRAAFWLAVVGAFMPRDMHAEPDALAAARSAALSDAETATSEFCAEQPDLCAAGEQAVIVGAAVGKATLRIVLESAAEAAEARRASATAGAATDALAATAFSAP